MVFDDLQVIFLHPGKTAGTSFEQLLMPGHRLDPYVPNRGVMFGWDASLGIFLQHATCRVVRDTVGEELFERYFKFSVVRDPYARLVSIYYYLFDQHEQQYGGFRNFVLALPQTVGRPAAQRGLHVTPQVAYTHLDGIQAVDHVGRFERLDRTTALLADRFGVPAQLPRTNEGRHRQRPNGGGGELYDDEMVAVMQAVYRADFETFGYPDRPAGAPSKPAVASLQVAAKPTEQGGPETTTEESLPRIFVQIPSYRDPECQWTVKDLFDKARHPERVFVGICWQFDDRQDRHCFEVPAPRPENVRTVEFHHLESQGLGWARSQAMALAAGEEYTLQIDAHMRFVADWDELLIDMIRQCPTERCILSHYPPSFIPPDRYHSNSVPYMYPARFNKSGIPMEKSFAFGLEIAPERPVLNYFVAGGLLFAPSTLFHEVPPDPHVYFWGEQVGTAVRAWTRGWNIYSPHRNSVYHIYHVEQDRPLNWDDNPEWVAKTEKTAARMQYLLGTRDSLPDEYAADAHLVALGRERELVEYEQLAGVSFRDMTVHPHMIDYSIQRLRHAGTRIKPETEEWYRSIFVIDQIAYDADDQRVKGLFDGYLPTATKAQHRFNVQLHYARRQLEKRVYDQAEEYAYAALRSMPEKPNGYGMVGQIHLRQGQLDKAFPMLSTARQLAENGGFSPILIKEPHPLTLLALWYCKKLMPDQAVAHAKQALALDHVNSAAIGAIIEQPDNPIGKDFWLFPDKKHSFNQYQAKSEVSKEWREWAATNAKNVPDRRVLSLKIQDVGFRAELVDALLDTLYG